MDLKKFSLFCIAIIVIFNITYNIKAYSYDSSGNCNCSSCSDCTTAIIDSSHCYSKISLISSIANQNGNCIEFNGKDNITFDCNGYAINGDGDSSGYGIYLDNSSDNNIIKNCPNISNFRYAVYIRYSKNVTLQNLTANSNYWYGVYIYKSNLTLLQNITSNLNQNDGIHVYMSNSTTLENITSNTNKYNGISIYLSNQTILRNTLSSSNQYGIHIDYSSSSDLQNITCSSNNGSGIFIYYSDLNTIGESNFSSNYYGLEIQESHSNNLQNITANSNSMVGLSIDSLNLSIFQNITAQENNFSDIIIGTSTDSHCNNLFQNITVSGNRPFGYYNYSVNISDEVFSELILCNADGSNITNVTIQGSDTLNNNLLYVHRTENAVISEINSSNNRYGIYFDTSNSSIAYNLTLLNNSGAGILTDSSNLLNISEITSDLNFYGIFVFLGESNTFQNISAINNSIGIYLVYSSSNVFQNITSRENNYLDVSIASLVSSHCNNLFQNITVSGNRPFGYYNYSVNISDEVFSELILCNANGSNITNVTIRGSEILDNNGLEVLLTQDSFFSDINSSSNFDGLFISDSENNTFQNSTFNSNSRYGLEVSYSNSNNFKNITLKLNQDNGIFIISSSYNNFSNIKANFNYKNGIYVWYSDFNIIQNTTINSNNNGIKFAYADNNTIKNNYIGNNTEAGIYINTTFYASSNNLIWNNLLNNSINLFAGNGSSTTNFLNTTKIFRENIIGGNYIGGNFWAKPNGTGFSETCADNVAPYGICDNYYNLTNGSSVAIDWLPLKLNNSPAIELKSPANSYSSTNQNVIFKCMVYDADGIANVSLYINNELNATNTSALNNVNYTFSKQLSVGSYNWTCRAYDSEGNPGIASYRTLSITSSGGDSGDSDSSSGGGGGGSGTNTTNYFWVSTHFVLDTSPFNSEKGYSVLLAKKNRVRFLMDNNEYHYVGIVDINNNASLINVSSKPQQAEFIVGDTKKFDVTNDSYYDLSVTLNEIKNNMANITIKFIHELKSSENEAQNNQNSEKNASNQNSNTSQNTGFSVEQGNEKNLKERNKRLLFWILIGSLITMAIGVVLIYYFFYFKKIKNSHDNTQTQ